MSDKRLDLRDIDHFVVTVTAVQKRGRGLDHNSTRVASAFDLNQSELGVRGRLKQIGSRAIDEVLSGVDGNLEPHGR